MSVIQSDKLDEFLGDLDTDEAGVLIHMIAGLDSTEVSVVDGVVRARWTPDEMSLIGKFQDFLVDNVEEDEDEEDEEDEDILEDDEEEDGDILGTGEDEPVASSAEPTA